MALDLLSLDIAFEGLPFDDTGPESSTSLDAAFEGQPFAYYGAAAIDAVVATSQAQHTLSAAPVDSTVATSQGQGAGAALQAQWDLAGTTSQGQSSSAQGKVSQSWALLDRVYVEDTNYTSPPAPTILAAHDLVAGSQVVVAVFRNRGNVAPLSVTDSAGNVYQLAAQAWQEAWGPIASLYVALNVIGQTGNVIQVGWDDIPGPVQVTVYYIQSTGIAFVETTATQVSSTGTSISAPPVSTAGLGFMVALQQSSVGDGTLTGLTPGFTSERDVGRYGVFGHRINTAPLSNTVVNYTGTSSAARALAVVALAEASGTTVLSRQAQSSSATAGISADFSTVDAATSQAQHSATIMSLGTDAVVGTAQGQRTVASSGATLQATATTAQGQASSAQGDLFQPGSTATAQGQSSAAQADVVSSASAAGQQVQAPNGVLEISLDAAAQLAQAQASIGALDSTVDSAAATSSAQQSAGTLSSAYVLDVATAQDQQADAVAEVSVAVQVASMQAQGSGADASVSADASATAGQVQRTRAQTRAESVNTSESGQVQHVAGQLGLSSDAPTATRQGQASALLAGVVIDTAVAAGQAQHIGDGNVLIVAVDTSVTTFQDQQHAAGVLEQYQALPGTLSLGTKRLHPSLAGTAQALPALDAAIRVRGVLGGHVDLRPER